MLFIKFRQEELNYQYVNYFVLTKKIPNFKNKFPFRPKLASENQTNNLRQYKSFIKLLGQSVAFKALKWIHLKF